MSKTCHEIIARNLDKSNNISQYLDHIACNITKLGEEALKKQKSKIRTSADFRYIISHQTDDFCVYLGIFRRQ